MDYYKIKEYGKDFEFDYSSQTNTKGTRMKKIAYDKNEKVKAYFKYEKYNASESCSEKMSYEIAKTLNYECARIEFARDDNGVIGVLNYLFIDKTKETHHDAKDFMNATNLNLNEYHTIENIENFLNQLVPHLFPQFLKTMVFDALVGETDRHGENWGITKKGEELKISALYDNGCNLLRQFKNMDYADPYYTNKKPFDIFIKRSPSLIYSQKTNKKFKLFKLIEYLNDKYPKLMYQELFNLHKLTDTKIVQIVESVPDELLTKKHKEYIIIYLRERKKILLNMMETK